MYVAVDHLSSGKDHQSTAGEAGFSAETSPEMLYASVSRGGYMEIIGGTVGVERR